MDGVRSFSASPLSLSWSWYGPCDAERELPLWLHELRQLRSRVLHEGGRRPDFGPNGPRHGDPDPLDPSSAHVAVRDGTSLMGCVRITPLTGPLACVTETVLGRPAFDALLHEIGAARSQIAEHGRWIVDPAYQAIGTGIYLMSASFALAAHLGHGTSIATVSEQVVPILARAGARLSNVPPLNSVQYDDRLRIMYGHQREFPALARAEFRRMARVLSLEVSGPRESVSA